MHPAAQLIFRRLYLPAAPLIRRLYRILPRPVTAWLRLLAERLRFADTAVVHDLPPIAHYWSNRYLVPLLQSFGFSNLEQFFLIYLRKACTCAPAGSNCRFISLGAGNCDLEVRIAARLISEGLSNFQFDCLELNEKMLARGYASAQAEGIGDRMKFVRADIAEWRSDGLYDAVLVNQFLHHVVDLESLFAAIKAGLATNGRFLTSDIIGRNGHMRWPEALERVETLWEELPERYKYNHLHGRTYRKLKQWDCSVASSEGIRAQDILPLLIEHFGFEIFIGFGNLVDVFIERTYGPNFDPDRDWDRAFIDRVQAMDQAAIETGAIKPTHMIAALTPDLNVPTEVYRHLTPNFCVRDPTL